MIHAYIFLKNIRDGDHGPRFRALMKHINEATFPDPQVSSLLGTVIAMPFVKARLSDTVEGTLVNIVHSLLNASVCAEACNRLQCDCLPQHARGGSELPTTSLEM